MSIIVDCNINEKIKKSLVDKNIEFFKSFDVKNLYFPVSTHPDMQIHFADKELAFVAPIAFSHHKNILPKDITLIKGDRNPEAIYPGDCAYNIAVIGKRIVGNLKYIDTKIKEYYSSKGYDFINVKQGYSKCNLCIVDENSVITEDEGLFKSLTEKGINVLKIHSADVDLSGFSHGFIGGASGFIAPGEIAFYGDLTKHPDYSLISEFIKERGVAISCLSEEQLTDYGSILFF